MQISSRLRRLNEFVKWFELTYGIKVERPSGDGIDKVCKTVLTVRTMLNTHLPKCYWCLQVVDSTAVEVDTDTFTLHHIDENRDNDRVENLAICHKTCHQRMHKLSTSTQLPTTDLWSVVKCGRMGVTSWNEAICKGSMIPGIGRG